MSEVVADMEDWSLQAIVRGSSGDFGNMNMEDDYHPSFLESSDLFPNFFEGSTGSSDELEELYKPFYYPATHSLPDQIDKPEDKQLPLDQSDQSSGTTSSVTPANYTPKYKKRKNQHKRVVIQVSAEGLSSDMWAWRKYGQKPIKGSPYPRSYYRCSSSKGCLARKQVEESSRDPGMFIVTYTAEHSHSKPTRRNSLAGTVRQKFPSTKTVKREKSSSPAARQKVDADHVVHLPTSLIKEEEMERREDHDLMSQFVFNDDFFSGLEDFDEFVRQVPTAQAVRSCSWF